MLNDLLSLCVALWAIKVEKKEKKELASVLIDVFPSYRPSPVTIQSILMDGSEQKY